MPTMLGRVAAMTRVWRMRHDIRPNTSKTLARLIGLER